MNTRNFVQASALASSLAVATAASAATEQLVSNGDFETGDLSDWSVVNLSTVTGSVGTDISEVQLFDVTGDGSQSDAGAFAVEFGGIALEQTIEVSTTSDLAFSADLAALFPGSGISVINSYGGFFELMLDSLSVDSFDFGSLDAREDGGLERSSLSGTLEGVSAGSYTLSLNVIRSFGASGDLGGPFQFVDNISVLASPLSEPPVKPPSPIPLPAGFPLLLAGLGAIGLTSRFRK